MNRTSKRALQSRMEPILHALPLSFTSYEEDTPYISKYKIPYCCSIDPHVKLFVSFYLNPDGGDWFTLLFGWSTKGRYPHVVDMKFAIDDSPNFGRFVEEEYIERTRVFFRKDIWWVVDTKSEGNFNATVAEIERVLRSGVVPYLQEYLRFREFSSGSQ
jgi:hypothetical protein